MAYLITTACLLGTFCFALALGPVPLAADAKKTEAKPEVVIYFHTGGGDTKDTPLPKGTRIRVRLEAGEYDYLYDGTTIDGETVGDIAEQIHSNMEAFGFKATLLKTGLGVAAYGCAPKVQAAPKPYKTVTKVGIHYSGTAQPILPRVQGGVQLLILDKEKWKPLLKP